MSLIIDLTYVLAGMVLLGVLLAGILVFVIVIQVFHIYQDSEPLTAQEIADLNTEQKQIIEDYIQENQKPFTRRMFNSFFGEIYIEPEVKNSKFSRILEKQQEACRKNQDK